MKNWDNYYVFLDGILEPGFVFRGTPPPIDSVCTNVSEVTAGALFIPISPSKTGDAAEISRALAAGAGHFLYEPAMATSLSVAELERGIPVSCNREALFGIGHGWRQKNHHLPVFAVAGSFGKSVTVDILSAILGRLGPTVRTPALGASDLDVAKALMRITDKTSFCAIEMSAKRLGDIAIQTKIAEPDIAACIQIGTRDLDKLGGTQGVQNAMLELYAHSPLASSLIANGDDPNIVSAARASGRSFITFGKNSNATIRLREYEWTKNGGMRLAIIIDGTNIDVRMRVAHSTLPINATAATAMAHAFGISPDAIHAGLQSFRGEVTRYTTHTKASTAIIDDTANASPDGMREGIVTTSKLNDNKRIALILGDLPELGRHAASHYREIAYLVTHDVRPNWVVALGGDSHKIISALKQYPAGSDIRALYCKKLDDLQRIRDDIIQSSDIIYVNGSSITKIKDFVAAVTEIS